MGIIKKRIIKYSIITGIGILLFTTMILLIVLLCSHNFEFIVQFIIVVLIAILLMPSLLFSLVGLINLSVILKYYVAKEKHPRFSPGTYNFIRIIAVVIILSSIVFPIVIGIAVDNMEVVASIGVVGIPIGVVVYLVASYFRSLYFAPHEEQVLIKCPYCNNIIPKRAHYCIYCDDNVTESEVEELKEIMRKLDENNKTSFYK